MDEDVEVDSASTTSVVDVPLKKKKSKWKESVRHDDVVLDHVRIGFLPTWWTTLHFGISETISANACRG